jgi:hypothetical protein
MTLADFTAEYSGDVLVITNNINNTQLSNSTVLTNQEMRGLVGAGWICFPYGGIWSYDASLNYVGTMWSPV